MISEVALLSSKLEIDYKSIMYLYKKIIPFYQQLSLGKIRLPRGVKVMNPYKGENEVITARVMENFYLKFYHDNNARRMILGINPGRFGAGKTGLMFTDTIRLNEDCGININEFHCRELSSEFFYKVIMQYGGVKKFYGHFYISAVSPLGYLVKNEKGKEINYNYYDSPELQSSLEPFIKKTLLKQMEFNIKREVCFCLGTGKNYKFLVKLNNELKLFNYIIPLEHPRFIMQYKRRQQKKYIDKYIKLLKSN